MMKSRHIYIHILFLFFASDIFYSCTQSKNYLEDGQFIDFAHIATKSLKNGGDNGSAQSMANDYRSNFDAMLAIMGINDDGDEAVTVWLESPAVTAFAHDVDSIAPSTEEISKNISYIVANAGKEGLILPVNSYATAIWGKPQSILFADSTMFVALNHYLGSDHPAYAGLPEYRRYSKTAEMLPYDIAEALIATAYPFEYNDSTAVINRLIYEGAIAAAKMALVKKTSLGKVLGYTDQQLQWLENNEAELWRKMVGSKMIFDRSSTVAERLVLPSPATSILSPDCPGRAGRFIGYKIVESYMKNHRDAKLGDLLTPQFYAKSNPLTATNYNP